MWDFSTNRFRPSREVLARAGIEPLILQPKEGLAMINGTQFISSLGCEALVRAKLAHMQADIIAAMSLEALKGSPKAYDRRVCHFVGRAYPMELANSNFRFTRQGRTMGRSDPPLD